MGNSKSKKMKITQSEPQNNEEDRGRINAIKTDISSDGNQAKKDNATEQKDKDNDNASSASTVEVLDDK